MEGMKDRPQEGHHSGWMLRALADMLWPALSSVASAGPSVCWLPSHFVHDPVFSSGVLTSLPLRPARPVSQVQLLLARRASVTTFVGSAGSSSECSLHVLYRPVVPSTVLRCWAPQQGYRPLQNILDFLKEMSVRHHANH